ncbi:hypothetical protein U9M48_037566 [Paspalum notatum var. saurae]|uniref:Uncharacterized protein n=1 Tax=Paspalum notatum var. saurae TaxID=547442 RepID=A0AAQ3X9F4_PASNO
MGNLTMPEDFTEKYIGSPRLLPFLCRRRLLLLLTLAVRSSPTPLQLPLLAASPVSFLADTTPLPAGGSSLREKRWSQLSPTCLRCAAAQLALALPRRCSVTELRPCPVVWLSATPTRAALGGARRRTKCARRRPRRTFAPTPQAAAPLQSDRRAALVDLVLVVSVVAEAGPPLPSPRRPSAEAAEAPAPRRGPDPPWSAAPPPRARAECERPECGWRGELELGRSAGGAGSAASSSLGGVRAARRRTGEEKRGAARARSGQRERTGVGGGRAMGESPTRSQAPELGEAKRRWARRQAGSGILFGVEGTMKEMDAAYMLPTVLDPSRPAMYVDPSN